MLLKGGNFHTHFFPIFCLFFALAMQATICSAQKFQPPQFAVKPNTPKAWALATAAILFQANGERHDILAGVERSPENIKEQKESVADSWGIYNKQDLLEVLDGLDKGGHRKHFEALGTYVMSLSDSTRNILIKLQTTDQDRNEIDVVMKHYARLGKKSLLGWDYCRYVSLCRRGYLFGYFTEEEAWRKIMYAARILQNTFDSWQDLGENYLIGREFWSYENVGPHGQRYRNAYDRLLNDPKSPWNITVWNLNLDSE